MDFEYQILDKVTITELKQPGRVRGIYIDRHGVSYQVRYFWEGKVQHEYFYSDEIQKRKDNGSLEINKHTG